MTGAEPMEADPPVEQILQEFRDGKDPIVSYQRAFECLTALGRPLPLATVKNLVVEVSRVGRRNFGRLGDFVEQADAYLARRSRRQKHASHPRTPDNGGPAFTCAPAGGMQVGMTLREYFAAHAPQAPDQWLPRQPAPERPRDFNSPTRTEEWVAYHQALSDWLLASLVEWRWTYADAMLAAREDGR